LDVAPLSLKIEIAGESMTTLIPINFTITTKKSQTFSSFSDNQSVVTIIAYGGEQRKTGDNNLLRTFDLTGIPLSPRRVIQIEVTLDVNTDGTINVSALNKSISRRLLMLFKINKLVLFCFFQSCSFSN
jgi:L1 cell adhesion molecule like protein